MIRPDGSEYFLLEVRKKQGWDERLPGEGLLIWRVVGNRPILEESHGVEGTRGPGVFLDSVPFPSAANNSFTPYTTPSSKSQLGGGLPVFITNITPPARRPRDVPHRVRVPVSSGQWQWAVKGRRPASTVPLVFCLSLATLLH